MGRSCAFVSVIAMVVLCLVEGEVADALVIPLLIVPSVADEKLISEEEVLCVVSVGVVEAARSDGEDAVVA